MKKFAAKLINTLHLIIVAVAATGWFFFEGLSLRVYTIAMLLILAQWLVYQNQCVLTVWEDRLLNRIPQENPGAETTFIGRIIVATTGKSPSHKTVNAIAYGIHCLCVTMAVIKIMRGGI